MTFTTMPERRDGVITTRVWVQDTRTGEMLHMKTKTTRIEQKGTGDVTVPVKVYIPVKLTKNYQAAGIEIGAEVPILGKRESLEDDIREGIDWVYEIVSDKLAEKAKELPPLLKSLARDLPHPASRTRT